ncbi:MAG: hypothetical protein ACRYG8_22615 [Janthinobacterium lividum]
MSETTTAVPAARTYAHVIGGLVVEILATDVDMSTLFPASLMWIDVTGMSPMPSPGWGWTGSQFSAPAVKAVAAPKLTSLQFMNLLTVSEQTAIATAAQSNANVLVWLLKISGATYVDLGDAATIAGVDAMATAGLLSAARAAAILANEAPATAVAS